MGANVTRREAAKPSAAGVFIPPALATAMGAAAAEVATGSTTAAQAAPRMPCAGSAPNDPSAAMQRADQLLRQMTVEEKAMQVSCVVPLALLGPEGPVRSQFDGLLGHGPGRQHCSG